MPLTPTTRLGLVKPDPDPLTGDFVDVSVFNGNADKIDGAISATSCTASTRPTGSDLFDGRMIRETDTRRVLVWNQAGTIWDPVNGAFLCTAATRPASPFPNMLIRETDTRKILMWNSTQGVWELLNGATTCTSGTRPASPFDGMMIRETDTRRTLIYNATQSVWDVIGNGNIVVADAAAATALTGKYTGMRIYQVDVFQWKTWDGTRFVPDQGTELYYGSRTTDKPFTGTEVGVLRIDNMVMFNAYKYEIELPAATVQMISGDTACLQFRISTAGAATTASTILKRIELNSTSSFRPTQGGSLKVVYQAAADLTTASVLLCLLRTGGAGNSTILGSATPEPIEMLVKQGARGLANTGVSV